MHLVSDVGFHLPATWFACADRLTRVAQGSLVRVDRQGTRLGPPAVIRL